MQFQFRLALISDLEHVRGLDAECFPAESLDLQPAAMGELESGIENAEILLALTGSEVVGMMQLHRSQTGLELLSLAITSRFRGMGLGRAFMAELGSKNEPISCVTSPNNAAMRALLESSGFVEKELLVDHFGPGRHRLLYQLGGF